MHSGELGRRAVKTQAKEQPCRSAWSRRSYPLYLGTVEGGGEASPPHSGALRSGAYARPWSGGSVANEIELRMQNCPTREHMQQLVWRSMHNLRMFASTPECYCTTAFFTGLLMITLRKTPSGAGPASGMAFFAPQLLPSLFVTPHISVTLRSSTSRSS